MTSEQEISRLREGIDSIDTQIVQLFEKRMGISKEIGDFKREHNMAIYDAGREQKVVEKATALVPEQLGGEVTLLMRSLMALAREYQRSLLFTNDEDFLPPPAAPKRNGVKVMFQGARGAWSMQAAQKIFPGAETLGVDFFEDVFIAVKNREADYGVVPIENSQSGAIGETYDLLRKYGCYVVGRTWIDIRHCLMAKESTKLGDIREVHSHPEGFKQCHRFLQGKSWDLVTTSNTAVAAENVRRSESDKMAAIGSPLAAELNGLVVLADNIVDSANNRTSFVVIGRDPEYTADSDLISVTFSLAHRSGSLCEALLPFVAAGLNLTRIESRPSSPEHYRFFAEIAGNIDDPLVLDTLRHVAGVTEYMEVIGCYSTMD
ncbi:MAG: chorismate mutase [Clostridiales Family XIII bacterium]|jgi:chorismate mutase/prephenate dehydratase|nr:chorismate mutase [Clostridiales Family XIII bacterium]